MVGGQAIDGRGGQTTILTKRIDSLKNDMRTLLFRLIHSLSSGHPRFIVLLSLAAAAAAGVYGVMEMELITDQDRLLSEKLEYHHRYMEFIRRFGDLEFLYILIEGPSEERMIQFADTLAERLRRSSDIREIIYSFETTWAKDFALHFDEVELEDLHNLSNQLSEHQKDIEEFTSIRSIDEILHKISVALESPLTAGANESETQTEELDVLLNLIKGEYANPFADLNELKNRIEETNHHTKEYLWSSGKRFLLMLVMPNKDYTTLSVIEKPLNRIRDDIWLTQQEIPNVSAGLTGRPALQADEMRTTNDDMKKSSVLALIGVLFLFVLFFRELARPVLTVLALLMAMGWTYGFVALTLGHLNLLSMVFALILIGLGVDFGIHFLHRYQEELKKEGNPAGGVAGALKGVGPGILTGALTSSVAFLLALLTNFRGLQELGYVAGVGIIFCLIAMLVSLSALMVSYDRHFRLKKAAPTPVHLLGLRHVSRYPRLTVLGILILTVALIPMARRVQFNDNLLELQADGLESVEYEHKLLDESDHSTWYCAFTKNTMEEVRKTIDVLKANPTVAGVESLDDALPRPDEERQRLLAAICDTLAPLRERKPYPYLPNPTIYMDLTAQLDRLFAQIAQFEELKRQMEQSQAAMQPNPEENVANQTLGALNPDDPQLQQMLQQMQHDPSSLPPELREHLQNRLLQQNMETDDPALDSSPGMDFAQLEMEIHENPLSERMLEQLKELRQLLTGAESAILQRLQRANFLLLEQPRETLEFLAGLAAIAPPTVQDLPQQIRSLYIGKDGSLLIMAFPKYNIWETERMKEFVGEMRKIDANVTGTPIQVYESSLLMRNAFMQIGLFSYFAVAILVFLDFFTLSGLFFVLFPLTLGVLWLVEIMGLFNVQLNLANFFAIPILIGIGVDNAVHFYHRYLETEDVETSMYTTGTTLTLTTLTTIVGFGSLIFASHKGLASLGILMAMGSATCWFACVVFLPTLLKSCKRK